MLWCENITSCYRRRCHDVHWCWYSAHKYSSNSCCGFWTTLILHGASWSCPYTCLANHYNVAATTCTIMLMLFSIVMSPSPLLYLERIPATYSVPWSPQLLLPFIISPVNHMKTDSAMRQELRYQAAATTSLPTGSPTALDMVRDYSTIAGELVTHLYSLSFKPMRNSF